MAAISESSDNTGSNEKTYHARPPIDRDITVVAGGDVHWSDGSVHDGIFPGPEGGTHMRIPLLRKWIWAPWDPYWPAMPRVVSAIESAPNQDTNFSPPGWKYYLESTKRHGLQFKSEEEAARHPFARIRETFRSADVAFANLETPISSRGRRQRYMFRSAPAFAEALSWAGIDVVSTANNHAMDAGEEGLSDTLMYLQHAGVEAAGSGSNLAEARRPVILDRAGVRLGFLAYTSFENSGPSGFALSQRSGVAPFDIRLVTEDIHKIRGSVDWVLVSIHWPVENSQSVHSQARALAHAVVDAGADIVLGHHPHVPSGIEVHHGKPIFYSFGNLTFGYPDHRHIWKDNFLARIIFSRTCIKKIELLPIAGYADDLAQPFLVDESRARRALADLKLRSAALETRVDIAKSIGIIDPSNSAIPKFASRIAKAQLMPRKVKLIAAVCAVLAAGSLVILSAIAIHFIA